MRGVRDPAVNQAGSGADSFGEADHLFPDKLRDRAYHLRHPVLDVGRGVVTIVVGARCWSLIELD